MSEPANSLSVLRRSDLVHVAAPWAVAGVFAAAGKLRSTGLNYTGVGVPALPWHVRPLITFPEVSLAIAGASLAVLLLDLTPPRARPLVALALSALAAVWAALEVFSQIFFEMSASTIDFSGMKFFVHEFSGIFGMLVTGVPAAAVLVGTLWILLILRVGDVARAPSGALSGRARGYLAAATVGALALANASPGLIENRSFERGTGLNIFWSGVELARDRAIPTPAEPFPVNARLVGDNPPRNVVIVMLESTGWEQTSLAHPELGTTPFLLSLAETSTVVERAYAVYPHSLKAITSMMCGVEPRLDTVQFEALRGGVPGRCLPHLLEERGYETAYFQTPLSEFEAFDSFIRNLGFSHATFGEDLGDAPYVNYHGPSESTLLAPSAAWLASLKGAPFLAAYLTNSAHHLYGLEETSDLTSPDVETAQAAYRKMLRQQDDFLRELLRQYSDAGLYENTLFVVVGDHGEAFGQHGTRGHNDTINEEGVRVPWLFHTPWAPEPERLPGPAWQPDLLPTIAHHLGYELDSAGARLSGVDVRDAPPDRAIYALCFTARNCMSRTAGPYKAIDYFGKRPPQLFDLTADPAEETNLAEQHPELLAEYLADANRWRDEVRGRYLAYDRSTPGR